MNGKRIFVDDKFKKFVDNMRDDLNKQFGRNGKKPPISIPKVTEVISRKIDKKDVKKELIDFFNLK